MAAVYGVEMDERGLLIVRIEKKFRAPEEIRLIRRRAPDEAAPDLPHLLATTLEELGHDRDEDHLVLLYPASRLTWRRITTPLTSLRKIRETLPVEIEAVTPFDAGEIVADYAFLTGGEGRRELFAVATLRRGFEEWLAPFKEAGIEPDAVVPQPMVYAGAEAGGKVAVVDLGYRNTVVTLLAEGKVTAFHTIENGLFNLLEGVAHDEDELARRLAGEGGESGAPLDEVFDRLVNDITGSVGSLDSREPNEEEKEPQTILVTGAAASLPGMAEALANNLGVTVERWEPASGAGRIDEERGGATKTPVGRFTGAYLATRRYLDGGDPPLQSFLTGVYGRKRRLGGLRTEMALTGALVGAVIVITLFSLIYEMVSLNNRYTDLKNEIRGAFTTALPEVTTIHFEEQQLKNALADLEKRRVIFGVGGGDPFLDQLAAISHLTAEDRSLEIEQYTYEAGGVTLAGTTGSFELVERLERKLAALPWGPAVTVREAKTSATSGKIRFIIELKGAA